jgi:CBS-domain-containing membrane protein
MKNIITYVKNFIGVHNSKSSHHEKIISGVGGFVAISLVLFVTQHFISAPDATLIVASMGASAVLLFAVPHGSLSQPWALGCGQLVSAFIGVSCYLFIPNLYLSAAMAVGLSIITMHYLRCIHPPGGATALSAVMAGPSVHELGYHYVVTPVLINVVVIFSVAIVYNYFFSWRRYPAILMTYTDNKVDIDKPTPEGLENLQSNNVFPLVNQNLATSHEDLGNVFQLDINQVSHEPITTELRSGHYYSNSKNDNNWSIRQIESQADDEHTGEREIIYKIVAGKGKPSNGTMRYVEFSQWAKHEVYLNGPTWKRRETTDRINKV